MLIIVSKLQKLIEIQKQFLFLCKEKFKDIKSEFQITNS